MPRALLLLTLLAAASTTHAQWQLQDAHTTADLRGIDNVGNGVAWASGSDGTILRTEDAGFVWQLCAKPPGGEHLDFRAIQASDNNTAIIMSSGKGDLSRLYKTTDGCQTWTLLFTNSDKDGFWDALQFRPERRFVNPATGKLVVVPRNYGLLIGDPVDGKFAIYVTADAGSTWKRWNGRHPKAKPNVSLFAASNSALSILNWTCYLFVTGGKGGPRIYLAELVAKAFGRGWRTKFTPAEIPMSKGESAGAFSVATKRIENGPVTDYGIMIVGGDYRKPDSSKGTSVFATYPWGSVRDFVTPTTPPHGYRSAVAYDPKTKTWITVGPNGTDISTDDGRNWRALHPDPKFNETPDADQHWNALSLPYVVGPHGRIATLRPSALTPAKEQAQH
jgi:hypothetical protein